MLRNSAADWTAFLCLGTVFYTYVGYWLVLWACARRRPVQAAAAEPTVSIVIAARNEASALPEKLRNLTGLTYPAHLLQTIVVSDGSTDDTAAVLARFPYVQAVLLPTSSGKAAALNAGVRHATGDLLLMLDVRQQIDPDALQRLVQPFCRHHRRSGQR